MLTLPHRRPIYLIIDALDESPDTFGIPPPREEVLQLITELVELRLRDLHICITSRPNSDIEFFFERLSSNSDVEDELSSDSDAENEPKLILHPYAENKHKIIFHSDTEDYEASSEDEDDTEDGDGTEDGDDTEGRDDTEDDFGTLTPLRVSLHDESGQREDIMDYVRSVVYSNSERIMRGWGKEEKDLVIETLSKRADGM
jgi:hypothetical protein